MAKFALECPHCGTVNKASTFVLAKKKIICGNCKNEIDVKANRMAVGKCPNCGEVAFDTAKGKCPVCKGDISLVTSAKATSLDDLKKLGKEEHLPYILCPQCNCSIQPSNKTCPVCDYAFDGYEEIYKCMQKEKLVAENGISVIKYEGDNETFVWKHPIEDFNLGTQLIVHESQEAIFCLNGQALDLFGPGRYSLETENLPMLRKVYELPTGKQNPFHAEVYFINKTVQMGIKWGTDSRVRFIDPETGIPLDIGASGELNLQVSDSRKLLVKLVGTTGGLKRSQLLGATKRSSAYTANENPNTYANESYYNSQKNYYGETILDENGNAVADNSSYRYNLPNQNNNQRNMQQDLLNDDWASTLRGYFRPQVMTAVKSHLASVIQQQRIDILNIDSHLETLSASLREKVSPGFEEYGLFVPQFFVVNVSLPEDDRNFKKLRDFRSASYIGQKEAEIEADLVAARRRKIMEEQTTDLERAKFEAEKMRIKAQAEADILTVKGSATNELRRQKGLYEAEVMAHKGYNQRDVLQAEVQKEFAKGIGQFGANGGGGSGIANDMLGLGMGVAVAGTIGGQMNDVMKSFNPTAPINNEPKPNSWKCQCGQEGNLRDFCPACGKPKPVMWNCTACGEKNQTGDFCVSCGKPKPVNWTCTTCGASGNSGAFCPGCGSPAPNTSVQKKPDMSATWNCSCGQNDIVGNFCPNCGSKRKEE